MENISRKNKKIELAFPKVESIDDDDNDDEYISKGPSQKLMNYFSTSIDELTEWFRNYQVESIEVWISRIVESNGIARLVLSAKGEGRFRVMLKPKNQS